MSYTVGYDYTTIPTDKETEELKELVSNKLSALTNLILTQNEDELAKLEMGGELTEIYEEEIEEKNAEDINQELSEFVSVIDSDIKIYGCTESNRHFPYPLLSVFAPLMNKEWVIHYSVCEDSRRGSDATASIITKDGEWLALDEDTISIKR